MTRIEVIGVGGIGEIRPGDDLAEAIVIAVRAAGGELRDGDVVAVSSKVASKAQGLTASGERDEVVLSQSRRVVAERLARSGITRITRSVAGPTMAAAGVDASNTGPDADLLLLPANPDASALDLRARLLQRLALPTGAHLGVILTDTAGRPWRAGLTDFALGVAGLRALDDETSGTDRDGRPLAVTVRAIPDELAAAADLVRAKASGTPVVIVRGLDGRFFGPGEAAELIRGDESDWFAYGHVEAVRAALGAAPGSPEAAQVGCAGVEPEPLAARVERVVTLALLHDEDAAIDVEYRPQGRSAVLTCSGADDYGHGRLVERVAVAAASESLRVAASERLGPVTRMVVEPVPLD